VKPGGAEVWFRNSDGELIENYRYLFRDSARKWTVFQKMIACPPGAATMDLGVFAEPGGMTWYDDVCIIQPPCTKALFGTPSIDGTLDDALWSSAPNLGPFADYLGRAPARADTRAWIAYDDQNLYLAVRCEHTPGAELDVDVTRHDDETWDDDGIQLFIDPWNSQSGWYRIVVNAMGVIRDQVPMEAGVGWESNARVAARRNRDHWILEMAVPFSSLDLARRSHDTWRINVMRRDSDSGQSTAWSLYGVIRPAFYGYVEMKPDLGTTVVPQAALRADELEAARESVLSAMKEMGLTGPDAAPVLRPLERTRGLIQTLREKTGATDPRAEEIWNALGEVEAGLSDSRRAVWRAFLPGDALTVALAGSLFKFPKTGLFPDLPFCREVRIEAARDEAESFQILIEAGDADLRGVRIETQALRGPDGATLGLVWHPIGYVETVSPNYGVDYVGWWPDVLMPAGPFDVPARELQPVWCTVEVPPDAPAGAYEGTVLVRTGENSVRIPVRARVRTFRLPRPGTLAYPFGVYASTLSGWYCNTKDYRETLPIEDFAAWCEFLGQRRLTPKNIAHEYWIKTKDGVDASALRKTVGALASRYYPPWSFGVYRMPVGKTVAGYKDRSARIERTVEGMKSRIAAYRHEGLPESVYIYGVDEPKPPVTGFLQDLYAQTQRLFPGIPLMQTMSHKSPREELVGLVDIWCVVLRAWELFPEFYRERVAAGDTVWVYLAGALRHPFPNLLIDNPAIDHRVLLWQVQQSGAKGLLYWLVSAWRTCHTPGSGEAAFPDVPMSLKDEAWWVQKRGVNGDGILTWPGKNRKPLSSIRLEILRDGIEDCEYLALLGKLVEQARGSPVGRRPGAVTFARAEALAHVPREIANGFDSFSRDADLLLSRREEIGDMIEELMAVLRADQ